MGTLLIKRIYEPPAKEDGLRVLVDRLWPRGLTKEKVHIHHWLKDVAPSTALRQWFHHDEGNWESFRVQYLAELSHQPAVDELIGYLNDNAIVTLLYGAHDEQHNHALVLQQFIEQRIKKGG